MAIFQHQRENIEWFARKITVLVATDVAARGLDIPNVDLIIHYELPNDPETRNRWSYWSCWKTR